MKKIPVLSVITGLSLALILVLSQVTFAFAEGNQNHKQLSDKEKAITFLLDIGWDLDKINKMAEDDLMLYKDAISLASTSSKYYRITSEKEITEEYDASKGRIAKKFNIVEGTQKVEEIPTKAQYEQEIAQFKQYLGTLNNNDLQDLYPTSSVAQNRLGLSDLSYPNDYEVKTDDDGWITLNLDLVYYGVINGNPTYSLVNLFEFEEETYIFPIVSEDIISIETDGNYLLGNSDASFAYYWTEQLLVPPYGTTYESSSAREDYHEDWCGSAISFNQLNTWPGTYRILDRWGYIQLTAVVNPDNYSGRINARGDYFHQTQGGSFSFSLYPLGLSISPSTYHDQCSPSPSVHADVSP